MSDDEAQKCKKLCPMDSMDIEEFDLLATSDRNDKWKEIQSYIEALESVISSSSKTVCTRSESPKDDIGSLRSSSVLSMKLARKDREVQELLSNMSEMRQYSAPSGEQLRRMLLDPAVNLMFRGMASKLEETEKKLKEAQEDTAAWKFTTDSLTGKRLMAKCRQLHQENEQLGQQISSGRIAKLEGDLALQKQANEELKKNQSELEDCVEECEEESEALESMCHFFKENLKEKEEVLNGAGDELRTCEKCGHVTSPVLPAESVSLPVTTRVDRLPADGVKCKLTSPRSPAASIDRTTRDSDGLQQQKTDAVNMDANIVQHDIVTATQEPPQPQDTSGDSKKRKYNHTTESESAGDSEKHSCHEKRTKLENKNADGSSDSDRVDNSSSAHRTNLEGNPRKDRTVKVESTFRSGSPKVSLCDMLNHAMPSGHQSSDSPANGHEELSDFAVEVKAEDGESSTFVPNADSGKKTKNAASPQQDLTTKSGLPNGTTEKLGILK